MISGIILNYIGVSLENMSKWTFRLLGDFLQRKFMNLKTIMVYFSTDLFTEEAVRLIDNHQQNKPMFLMIAHIAPHSANSYDPLQAPTENINKFKSTIADENRRRYAGI